jgi:hypothetical protein
MDPESIFWQGNPTVHPDGPCPLAMPWHSSGKAAHGVAGSPTAEAERGLGGWTTKQINEDPIPHHLDVATDGRSDAHENVRSGGSIPLSHNLPHWHGDDLHPHEASAYVDTCLRNGDR